MKQLKMKLPLLLLAITLFVSCSKDDDNKAEIEEITNFLKITNDKYDLTSGLVEDYEDYFNTGVYNIDLSLLTPEFTVNNGSYEGNGRSVYFELFTSSPNKLELGTYKHNASQDAFSFDDAILFDNSTGDELEIEITSGTITVIKSEINYYELTFECTDEQGRVITGRYYGAVTYYSDLIP